MSHPIISWGMHEKENLESANIVGSLGLLYSLWGLFKLLIPAEF
jgi:hypothetical protein